MWRPAGAMRQPLGSSVTPWPRTPGRRADGAPSPAAATAAIAATTATKGAKLERRRRIIWISILTPKLQRRAGPVTHREYTGSMSYSLTLPCGCLVYVACNPRTSVEHTRVIEARGRSCMVRQHDVGLRLSLLDLLPDPSQTK